jgi:inner membrane transporter RhtA
VQHTTADLTSSRPGVVRKPRLDPAALGMVVLGSGFHYLGPSFAVLLFAHVDVLGVAWLRLASAAVVLAVWRRPWSVLRSVSRHERNVMVAWGIVLAGMNAAFYLALDRAPLATVASIEFLGVLALAAHGARSGRNVAALLVACLGIGLLTEVRIAASAIGLLWATANCLGFVLYVVLGHRVATAATRSSTRGNGPAPDGLDRLAVSVTLAALAATPFGLGAAWPALGHPAWLAWGIGVGICSTVIPYAADQVAMARLPRATYALLLSLLPVTAAVCGLVVLRQVPGPQEVVGIVLVVAGVALHRPPAEASPAAARPAATPETVSADARRPPT